MHSLRPFIAICVLTAATVSPASAQGLETSREKSPGAALTLSAFGTLVPAFLAFSGDGSGGSAAVFASAVVLGPSLGYLYAGDRRSAFKGIGVRAAVGAATIGAFLAMCPGGECENLNDAFTAVFVVAAGGAVVTALALVDIARVHGRVRARNERLARRRVRVSPAYLPKTRSLGFLVTIRP